MLGTPTAPLLRHRSLAALAVLALVSCGASERQLVGEGSGASCLERHQFPHVTTSDYEIVVTLSEPRSLVRGKRVLGRDDELIVSGSDTASPAAFSGREVSRLHVDVAICSRTTGARAALAPTLVIEDRSSHEQHPARLLRLERATKGANSFHYGNNVLLPHQPIFDLTVGGQRARLIPPNG